MTPKTATSLTLEPVGYILWCTLEKTLMLGKIEGKRRRGQKRVRWLDNITDSMDMNLSKLQEIVKDQEVWRAACGLWDHKESDRTYRLNNSNNPNLRVLNNNHLSSS